MGHSKKIYKMKDGGQALFNALKEKGYKRDGGESMLTKFTMGGGDLLGTMVAAGDGGEKYKYTIGGQTYSGKSKNKK